MIPLFLGLSAANILLLVITFAFGLGALDAAGRPTVLYNFHVPLGIAAGLMTTLAHLAVYTYFMATSKWLQAATDKAGIAAARFAAPALKNKRRVYPVAMGAIVLTMLTMFAGAAADPTVQPWWSGQVHLACAAIAILANMLCALREYRLIREQGELMDQALALLNKSAG